MNIDSKNKSSKNEPLVTIVMGSYNVEPYIEEAIDSVISQTYNNWELIIVDDASTDGTVDKILQYKDKRIKLFINEYNIGVAASLNRAIRCMNKDTVYIARLDSDDVSKPDRLSKQVKYMQTNSRVDIVGSNIYEFTDNNTKRNIIYRTHLPKNHERLMAWLPFGSPMPHSTWMIRVDSFDRIQYNPNRRTAEDYEFMYRIFRQGGVIACIEEPLVYYRVRSDSLSHNKKSADINTLEVRSKVHKLLRMKNVNKYVRLINMNLEEEDDGLKAYINLFIYGINLVACNQRRKIFAQPRLVLNVFKMYYAGMLHLFDKLSRRRHST